MAVMVFGRVEPTERRQHVKRNGNRRIAVPSDNV